jgi:chromosome segregation ATPase
LLGETAKLHTDGLQKDTELHRITVLLNKKDGENAGIRSSVTSLEEELSVLRDEIEGLEKQSSLENRKNKELLREIESLKSALTVEKGEVDNLTLRNEILATSQSRGNTPSKAPLSASAPGPSASAAGAGAVAR